jgi:hypothetical protein
MEVVVYIYGGKHATSELVEFRCVRCGRIMFKHNSKRMELSNLYGVNASVLMGQKDIDGIPVFTEHKCHSCKSVYKILFQY